MDWILILLKGYSFFVLIMGWQYIMVRVYGIRQIFILQLGIKIYKVMGMGDGGFIILLIFLLIFIFKGFIIFKLNEVGN